MNKLFKITLPILSLLAIEVGMFVTAFIVVGYSFLIYIQSSIPLYFILSVVAFCFGISRIYTIFLIVLRAFTLTVYDQN